MRIRTVKPEFFTHPDTVQVSIPARLLLLSLLTQADDDGRLRDQPRIIGALAFGDTDKVNPERLLSELASCPDPRIARYEVDGKRYIHIMNFSRHQVINRPRKSVLPPPELHEGPRRNHGNVTEDSRAEVEVEVEVEQGMEVEENGKGENLAGYPAPITHAGGLNDMQWGLIGKLQELDGGWGKVTPGALNKLKARYTSAVLTMALQRAWEAKLVPAGSAYGLLATICESVAKEQAV